MTDQAPGPTLYQALSEASIEHSMYFAPNRGFDVSVANAETGTRLYAAKLASLADAETWLNEKAKDLYPDFVWPQP